MNETQAVLFGSNNRNNSTIIVDKNTSVNSNSNGNNNSTFNVDEKNDDKENLEEQQLDDTYTLQPVNDKKDVTLNETVTISPTIRGGSGTTSRAKRKSARSSSNSDINKDDGENKQQQRINKKKSRMGPTEEEMREPLACEDDDDDDDDEMTSSLESDLSKAKSKDIGRKINTRNKNNAIHHSMVLPGEMGNNTTTGGVGTPLRPRRNPRRRSTAN